MLHLHSEVVVATRHQEVALHSPVGPVGIADDPVLGAGLLVLAPSDDDHRVVHVHPGDSLVVESGVADLGAGLVDILFPLLVLVSLGQKNFLALLLETNQALFTENAFFVNTEHGWSLKIAVDGAISQDLLHHFLL